MTPHTPSGQQAVEREIIFATIEKHLPQSMTQAVVKMLTDRIMDALREAAPTAPSTAPSYGTSCDWKLMPRYPSQEMMDAGLYQSSADAEWDDVFSSYVDMWEAAPEPEDYFGDTTKGASRKSQAHAAPSTAYPLAVTPEMLEAAKEGFHDADENNCDLDDCWGAALTAALGSAPSTAAGEREALSAPRAFETWDDMLEAGARAIMAFRGWDVKGEPSILERADENSRAREWVEEARAVLKAIGFEKDTFRSALATPPAQKDEARHGWVFLNPSTKMEWPENHPVESGEVEDAERVPWEEQAAQIRRDALEEAARCCQDARASAQRNYGVAEGFGATMAERRIRALLYKPAKGDTTNAD